MCLGRLSVGKLRCQAGVKVQLRVYEFRFQTQIGVEFAGVLKKGDYSKFKLSAGLKVGHYIVGKRLIFRTTGGRQAATCLAKPFMAFNWIRSFNRLLWHFAPRLNLRGNLVESVGTSYK